MRGGFSDVEKDAARILTRKKSQNCLSRRASALISAAPWAGQEGRIESVALRYQPNVKRVWQKCENKRRNQWQHCGAPVREEMENDGCQRIETANGGQ